VGEGGSRVLQWRTRADLAEEIVAERVAAEWAAAALKVVSAFPVAVLDSRAVAWDIPAAGTGAVAGLDTPVAAELDTRVAVQDTRAAHRAEAARVDVRAVPGK
jgi:hypothetical protein